jgi:hypothetical protein
MSTRTKRSPKDRFDDAVLGAAIRQIWRDMGGRAQAPAVYDKAFHDNLFPRALMRRLARRAGIELVRHCLSKVDPSTGFPFAYPIGAVVEVEDRTVNVKSGEARPRVIKPVQLWIAEVLMTAPEYSQMLHEYTEQIFATYGEYQRRYERGLDRFGRERMPQHLQQLQFEES